MMSIPGSPAQAEIPVCEEQIIPTPPPADPALTLAAGGQTPTIEQTVQGDIKTVLSSIPGDPIPPAEQSGIRLKKPLLQSNTEGEPRPRKNVLSIGDLDSNGRALLEILEKAGYIVSEPSPDKDGGIVIEPTQKALTDPMVQTGDIFDRGDMLIPALDIMDTIREAGGDWRITAGNHDVRALYAFGSPSVLNGDPLFYKFLRRLNEAWEKDPHADQVEIVKSGLSNHHLEGQAFFDAQTFWYWFITTGHPVMTELRHRYFPEGENPKVRQVLEKGANLFLRQGPYAELLTGMSMVEQIDDVLYFHGGINDWLADELNEKGTDGVNREFRQSIGTPELTQYAHGERCHPFWMRYTALTPKAAEVVKKMGVRAIVRGHDTQVNGKQGVTNEYGIHVIHNDVGIIHGNRSCVTISPTGEISGLGGEGEPETLLATLPPLEPKNPHSLINKLLSGL